jgi:hypothetical protein
LKAATFQRNVEGLGLRRRGGVPLAEFIDTAAGIHDFLLAGIERMAIRADLDLKIVPDGRAGLERIPASAGDGNCFVFGMDGGLHVNLGVAVGRIDEPDDCLKAVVTMLIAIPDFHAHPKGAAPMGICGPRSL